MQSIGKMLFSVGLILVVAGLFFWLLPGNFNWLGRLPGDIRYEGKDFKFYFPITTMLLLSLIFSIILNLIRRLF